MTDQMAIAIIKDAFYNVLLIVGPILIVSLVVGLIISIFQAATSISEQTLTFVPKLLAVLLLTVLILPFIVTTLKTYTISMFRMMETMGP
ncbi:MAG: flagellar biosynthesis protein FliQ [Candidatus Kapaibacteriota bacterium]|jgi:flagellar biosynthetic protein FliQ